jgi:hypothetical protein
MDSYHRRAYFPCTPYIDSNHGYVITRALDETLSNRYPTKLMTHILEYTSELLIYSSTFTERKTYDTRVGRNGKVDLLQKENFKRLSVCEKNGEILSN